MKTTSFRIEESQLNRLDALAELMDQSRGKLIQEALDRYIEYHEWFLTSVAQAVADVEEGRVVPHEAMQERFRSWGVELD